MKKKMIIGILIAVIGIGGIVGVVSGVKSYQKSKLVAEVQSVASLNWGYSSQPLESEGVVANDATQSIFLQDNQQVKEIYVSEGQEVKAGDKLMAYDVTSLEFSLEMKKLNVQSLSDQMTMVTKELERLKKITPVEPKTQETDGTDAETDMAGEEGTAVGEESGSDKTAVTTYTAEELAKAIREKEQQLKKLDLDQRKAKLEVVTLQGQLEDGVVYAKIDGVVKKIQDPLNPPNDGSAFLVVSGSEGLYVKGNVSELYLDQVQVGQMVMATSWQTGMEYMAEISAIDTYPEENPSYYGEGNPNSSYYAYTAYISDPGELEAGEYLGLIIQTEDESAGYSSLCIDKSYVREENGKNYVMKDDNGVLKKQYVTVGKLISGGYGIEIISGLTEEDSIAFPYGKAAQEGVATHSEMMDY